MKPRGNLQPYLIKIFLHSFNLKTTEACELKWLSKPIKNICIVGDFKGNDRKHPTQSGTIQKTQNKLKVQINAFSTPSERG